jgi:type II secretory pathway predicted ATPase ExeA
MHLKHYGLGTEPFGAAFESDCFYRGHQHRAALSFLERCFDIGRPGLALFGPRGVGKSSSLRFAIDRRRGGGRLGEIDGLSGTPAAFLAAVLEAFGFGSIEAGHAELRNLLSVFVVQARQNEQQVLLHVRDPQLPSPAVADEVFWLLSSVAPDGGFQLVFSGGEGLERLLDSPRLSGLAGLIRDRHRLEPLGEHETADYLHFRLGAAGATAPQEILPEAACRDIHQASEGIVRTINRLAASAVERAGRARLPAVDEATVAESAARLGLAATANADPGAGLLDVRLGNAPYLQLPLGERKILIGRHSHNEINLRDGSVSRHHAMIVPESGSWILVDLNSTNGTQVNGESVKHRRLEDGDTITVGNFRIEYRGGRDQASVPPGSAEHRRTVVLSSS